MTVGASLRKRKEIMKPILPDEVVAAKREQNPDEVIEVVNKLIVTNYSGKSSTVDQNDIVEGIVGLGYSRDQPYDNGWLNFEDIYREAGWKVFYDKPGYNENYSATFKFSRP